MLATGNALSVAGLVTLGEHLMYSFQSRNGVIHGSDIIGD